MKTIIIAKKFCYFAIITYLCHVRFSTSYHNKAICRRILSYMPSSEGIFVFFKIPVELHSPAGGPYNYFEF